MATSRRARRRTCRPTVRTLPAAGYRPPPRQRPLQGVSLLIALEDPAACPALTAPAIEALRRYFAADQLGDGAVANESQQLELVVECLWTRHDLAYYERIAPVAQSLVGLITRQPSTTASLRVVSALDDAPVGTVAGPLRCWADAMASPRHLPSH